MAAAGHPASRNPLPGRWRFTEMPRGSLHGLLGPVETVRNEARPGLAAIGFGHDTMVVASGIQVCMCQPASPEEPGCHNQEEPAYGIGPTGVVRPTGMSLPAGGPAANPYGRRFSHFARARERAEPAHPRPRGCAFAPQQGLPWLRASRASCARSPSSRARPATGWSRPRSRCRPTEAALWLRSGARFRAPARARGNRVRLREFRSSSDGSVQGVRQHLRDDMPPAPDARRKYRSSAVTKTPPRPSATAW